MTINNFVECNSKMESNASTVLTVMNNFKYGTLGTCDNRYQSILNSNDRREIILFFLNFTFKLITALISIVIENFLVLIIAVILVLIGFVIYKSYWSPVLYVKELSDIGFEHIKGPRREARISRAQNARRLGKRIPPPYPNGWFCVAESRDLKIGGVLAVDAIGQNLCIYRDEGGIARCVDAYCPHLGANLGVGGVVCGSCIECPFHKWRFGINGDCVSVPGQDTPPRGVGVRTWITVEAEGGVWIWHDAEKRPPQWEFQEAEECKHWAYRGRNEFIVNSHIQDIPENGADVAHLNAVHSPSLFTNLGEKYPLLLNVIGRHTWAAEWARGEGHTAEMRLTHDYKFGKVGIFHMDVVASQIGPGHVRLRLKTPFGTVLVSQSLTPLSGLQQKVVHRFYSPAYNAPVAAIFVIGESYMFERDIVIWNNKRFISNPAYVRSDKTIRAFRNWFSQFYSENSISYQDSLQDTLDW